MSKSRSLALGIELGYSKSRASIYFGENRIEYLQTKAKDFEIPSCISFTKTGILVGSAARKNVLRNFETTICSYMDKKGKRYSFIPKEYNIAQDDGNNEPLYAILEKPISPSEVVGHILNYIREEAAIFAKANGLRDVVITVPAHFNHLQREAVMDSAKIADLNVLQLINEVTAVAVSYCKEMRVQKDSRTILICHLGAVSFDVSLFSFSNNKITTKLSFSKTNIGGNHINNLILDWLLTEIKAKNNVNIPELSQKVLYKINQNIEKAKKELTFSEVSYIFVPFGDNFEVKLTRKTFNALINTFVQQILAYINENLQKIYINHDEITDIILTGGSFKILLLKDALQELFKNVMSIHTEHMAVEGAAIIAGQLKENRETFRINEISQSTLLFGNPNTSSSENLIALFKEIEYLPKTMDIVTTSKIIDISIMGNVFEYLIDSYEIQGFEGGSKINLTISLDCSGLLYIQATENNKNFVVSKLSKPGKHQSNTICVEEKNVLLDPDDLKNFEEDVEVYKAFVETLLIQDKYKEIFHNLCKQEWIKNDEIVLDKQFLAAKRKKIDAFMKFMKYLSVSSDESMYWHIEIV